MVKQIPIGGSDKRVLAISDSPGVRLYPESEFQYDATPYPVLADLIALWRRADVSTDSLFDWLVNRNVLLRWEAPADELKRSAEVLAAAEEFLQGHLPEFERGSADSPVRTSQHTVLERWCHRQILTVVRASFSPDSVDMILDKRRCAGLAGQSWEYRQTFTLGVPSIGQIYL